MYIIKQAETIDRLSTKLDYLLSRTLFRILKALKNDNFKLEIPEGWTAIRVYHVNRLWKYANNLVNGQAPVEPGGEVLYKGGEKEYKVGKMLASRTRYGKLVYQVQWRGWPPDATWYPASNFKNAPTTLKEFHKRNPEKAGPPLRLQEWLEAAESNEFDQPHEDDEKPVNTGTRPRKVYWKK